MSYEEETTALGEIYDEIDGRVELIIKRSSRLCDLLDIEEGELEDRLETAIEKMCQTVITV